MTQSIMNNLRFFDQNGHSVNFSYNDVLGRYEGDIIFDVNSNDTFKTQGIYTFQQIDAFQYESQPDLSISKFQLFNEYGINFYSGLVSGFPITKVEPVNLESVYFSKWVYGPKIDKEFPLGTLITFDSPLFEFNNPNQTYTVVSTKRGAILIISLMDNNTFSVTYPYTLPISYVGKSISSNNVIGVHNYINSSTLLYNLSVWNEPNFYDNLYVNRKLNIVDTNDNDSYKTDHSYESAKLVTISNPNFNDLNYFEYYCNNVPTDNYLLMEVITRTDLPLIFQGNVQFYDSVTPNPFGYTNVLDLYPVPLLLKPGVGFKVPSSSLNQQFFGVDSIPSFLGNANLHYYATGSQVMWKNKIYQCNQSYVWTATSSITPDDTSYWGLPTYVPLDTNPTNEILLTSNLYLTTDHLYFSQSWAGTSSLTLAAAAKTFNTVLDTLNINLYYSDNTLNADLLYPTQYVDINFYGITNSFVATSSINIGGQNLIYERAIGVEEKLNTEYNVDVSSNFSYNLVFNSLDDFGIVIHVNKLSYQVETQFVYISGSVDMSQTINNTLETWMGLHIIELLTLGVMPSLQTIGTSSYFNSLNLRTQYPNVPLNFDVEVGTTADFHIQHTQVNFYDPTPMGTYSTGTAGSGLGSFINITINNNSYGIAYPGTSIDVTLQDWVNKYYTIIESYGIYVSSNLNSLEFDVISQRQPCVISVSPGLSALPGDMNYEIVNLIGGNFGALITSNSIVLATSSVAQNFDDAGFATGMLTGINGTIFPLQNVEYNVVYLDPYNINLSYEGPFWGGTNSLCNISPYSTVAFSLGFGQTACTVISGTGGMFSNIEFSDDYNVVYVSSGTYSASYSVFNPFGGGSYTTASENNYGTLDPNYVYKDYLWLHTREYLRGPRYNFTGSPSASFYWKWFSDNVPEFFLYDFSGDLLPKTGPLAYSGPKPLDTVFLNYNANRIVSNVASASCQQTIFPTITSPIEYIDDVFDTSIVPQPMQTFIGYNSQMEGALRSILQLYIQYNIDFTINTASTDTITFTSFQDKNGVNYGQISFNVLSDLMFTADQYGNDRGLRPGQNLAIFIKDITNTTNQYISQNNGYLLQIVSVNPKSIIVSYFQTIDQLFTESTVVNNYPSTGQTTYLSVRFKVWDQELGRFNVFGQTEIEDIRYETELGNVGKLIASDDVYIFKPYDIKEEGIDWVYLNQKRKEMLMMKNMIYPYIGSYKAIINAINYFGYNDLQLYEYYRNINPNSPNYGQLFKVEIPNIFDNSVPGWKDNDFIKHTFPNANYQDTNLFNLTYLITDTDGNNLLTYSLQEVQTKLEGLKHWLQKNVIPISNKILDITGRASIVSSASIVHSVKDVQIFKFSEDFTPVSFKMDETYLMPVNSGSSVYNCVLDFYIGTQSLLPDYYTIDIRTYQIYVEWYAFTNYSIGDMVIYYNKLYESVIDNNMTHDPRKYENAPQWVVNTYYSVGDIVTYQNENYIWSGYGSTSSISSTSSPVLDTLDWINVTEWKEIPLVPIQRITERRRISTLTPYNFVVDMSIDPYLVIQVISDNGYGGSYCDRKNYEISGILDVKALESYTSLTSKSYIDATVPVVHL